MLTIIYPEGVEKIKEDDEMQVTIQVSAQDYRRIEKMLQSYEKNKEARRKRYNPKYKSSTSDCLDFQLKILNVQ